ncbi:hypothetical protein ACJX0J_031459, partial [Zea mays]
MELVNVLGQVITILLILFILINFFYHWFSLFATMSKVCLYLLIKLMHFLELLIKLMHLQASILEIIGM